MKLPKFENDYFKVTGQIRLSGMRIKESTKDRKQMIEACFEAFPFLDLAPKNAYPMNGGVSAEPLSNGVEIEYLFSLSFGLSELWVKNNEALAEFFGTWMNLCRPYIFRQSDTTTLAPFFLELLSKRKGNAWFEFQPSRGDMELVLSRDLWITYLVNDKPVFEVKIPKGTRFTETDSTVAKRTFEIWRTNNYAWTKQDLIMRNRVTYSDEEIAAKGLKSDIRYTTYRISEQYASRNKRKFFEENGRKAGVVTYEKGLKKFQYKILEEIPGRQPNLGDTISLHFTQSTLYGDTLATSYGDVPSRLVFEKSQGFLYEIVSKMRVGTVVRAWVPVEDFYAGKQIPAKLKGEEIVVLDLELVDIDENRGRKFLVENGRKEGAEARGSKEDWAGEVELEPEKNFLFGLMLYGGYGDFVVRNNDYVGSYLSCGEEIGIGFFWRYYFYKWGSFQTGLNLNLFALEHYNSEDYGKRGVFNSIDKDLDYSTMALEVPLQLRLGVPFVYGTALFTFRWPRFTDVDDDAAENYDKALFGFTGYAGFGLEITRNFLVDVLFLLFDLGNKSSYYTEQDNGVRVQLSIHWNS